MDKLLATEEDVKKFEATLIATSTKVIVAIEKGNDRLSFDISNVRMGRLVTSGRNTSLKTLDGSKHYIVSFGGAVAELPYETKGFGYLVMDEENVHALKAV
ncbi:MAG: hypothetical protein PHY47_00925 [Lachnospiraceae bacterium]|nr:hypothetical protein [Lachnospiraceae bacterium]